MSRARPWALSDSRPVCSWITMSRVPPVSIAAMGTPRAAASSSTRLSDSGPCDGNTSTDGMPHPAEHLVARQPALDAKVDARWRQPGVPATRAAGRRPRRPAATRSRRHARRRRGGPRPCSARACRRRARRARPAAAARRRRRAGCRRCRPDWESAGRRCPPAPARGPADRRRSTELTAMTASAALKPSRLRREVGAHVGDERPGERAGRPRATAQAPAHVGRRACLAEPVRVEVVDQIRPVAHGPVVANRGHHRHAGRLPRPHRRHRRQDVLRVDDVHAATADAPRPADRSAAPTAVRS